MGPVAPSTITAAFGTNLATQVALASTIPLPTTLANVTLQIIDGNNVQHAAPLFFVSPQQINYLIPDQAAPGNGRIIVNNGAGVVSQGTLQIANTSLGIFTVNASGSGIAAAVTTSDGVNFFSTVNPDGSPRAALNSTAWRPNFLVLFGTGFNRATNVRVSFGGVETIPTFVGAQGSLAGLSQLNVRIPDTTPPGVINIMVTADGRVSNTVQLLVQPLAFPPDNTLSVPTSS